MTPFERAWDRASGRGQVRLLLIVSTLFTMMLCCGLCAIIGKLTA